MYLEDRRVRGELAAVARCTWQSRCERAETTRIVPDACTDIIWNGRSLFVAGPDTKPVFQRLSVGDVHVGVRLAPGKNRVLAAPADALRDARVELTELWGDPARSLEDDLAAAPDPGAAGAVLQRAIDRQLAAAGRPDPLVQQLVRSYEAAVDASPSIARLAAALGITERQLLRRTNAALGYGPKLFARILRFQRFLACVRAEPRRSLAELAQDCGYADQAHLAHDTAEFAGVAPRILRDEAAARAMSDFDKPAAANRRQDSPHANDRTTRPLAI